MYKQDLAVGNLKWFICHKSQPTNQKPVQYLITTGSVMKPVISCLYRIHISSSLRISNKNILKNILEI